MAETMTFDAAAYTAKGTERERVSLPEALFDGTVNMPVMHQAVKAFLANQRQGNASTKTRGLVVGGNRKPWKQKGTGRARQGSIRAPQWVGGGTVFGPTPRAYDEYVPRQVRALARKSALNARAREGAIMVIDRFEFDAPKTSRLHEMLLRLGVSEKKVLILTDGVNRNVFRSGRNLPTTHVMPYSDVSTYHILWSDVVVIEAPAIGHALSPIEERESAEKPSAAKKSAARAVKDAKEARAAKAEAESGKARKKGPATTKPAAKKAAKKLATAKKAAVKSKVEKKKSKAAAKKAPAAKKKPAPKKKGK